MKTIEGKRLSLGVGVLWTLSLPALAAANPVGEEKANHVFEERNGIVSIEAENYSSKRAGGEPSDPRAWHVVSLQQKQPVKPDFDPAHIESDKGDQYRASGKAYLEALPDKRTEDHPPNDVHGFQKEAGRGPVVSYRVRFKKPGKYILYLRGFSTSSADESAHLGMNGTWPATGANVMWCSGEVRKAAGGSYWFWSSDRRDNPKTGCGSWNLAFVEVKTAGEHSIDLSMREDGSEIDKLVLLHESLALPEKRNSPTLGTWGPYGPAETRVTTTRQGRLSRNP